VSGPVAVITGIGLTVPNSVGDITDLFDTSAAERGLFDREAGLRGRDMRHKDRASRLALRAAESALHDAHLLDAEAFTGPADRTAVVVSSNLGNLDSVCAFVDIIARETVTGLSPLGLPHTSSNAVAGWVAIRYGLRGPNVTICNGPTGGLDALFWARNLVAARRSDVAVVIGVEPDTEPVARLLQQQGKGSALDGAVAVVVESAGYAQHRGVRARGVLAGYARATDLSAAITAARGLDQRPVQLLDAEIFTTRFGYCCGALGVLQCAAGAARLDRDDIDAVLATIGAADDAEAAAALLLSRAEVVA
jgi:3-oxoacyl-[acyl-carrier-protein] synthase II